jgi:protein-disulfide isomerase
MATRKEIKSKLKKKQKRQDLVPILIIGGLVVIVLAIVILSQVLPNLTSKNQTPTQAAVTIPTFTIAKQTDGLSMGDPNAKVKVEEYADFQCPYCGVYWAQYEPNIIAQYVDTGKVYFTYHPFSFLGTGSWDESVKSSEAAYCANDQGKFWEYRSMLYGNQNGENAGAFSKDRLISFAQSISLDMTTFEKCLTSDTHKAEVESSTASASAAGATYTPSFLVGGKIVNMSELTAAIDAELAK